jgi:ankyrin repeat protein
VQELSQLDKHGLTPLHVAAMRNNDRCIAMLLEAGFDIKRKSSGGWIALEEALCFSSKLAIKVLQDEHKRRLGVRMKEQLLQLKEVFKDMPDCAFQVRHSSHRVCGRREPLLA